MQLHKLSIKNFCGIKELAYDFEGKNCRIYGDNATGKTTIVKALTWLLIGKDHTGMSELDPAPMDDNNQRIPQLEVSVEAEFEHDGAKTSYRKVLTEVWRKPRGAKEAEFSGNKTDYYINSVPMRETQFTFAMMNIAQSEKIKILMLPTYFPTMAWKTRRAFLIDVCGDVTDSDIVASNEELTELPDMLGQHTVEEFLKISKAKKIEIKREIDTLPARITENENAIPELKKPLKELEQELSAYEKVKSDLQLELASASSENSHTKKIAEIKTDIAVKRSQWVTNQSGFNDKIQSDITDSIHDLRNAQAKKSELSVNFKSLELEIKCMNDMRKSLLEQHKIISAKEFNEPCSCPTCGQAIPEAKQKEALEIFNKSKSDELEKIINSANTECHKDMIAKKESELQSIKSQIEDSERAEANINEQISKLRGRLDIRKFEDSDEYKKLYAVMNALQNKDSDDSTSEIKAKIDSITESIKEVMEQIAEHNSVKKIKDRIKELKNQHEKLSDEFLHYEKGEYLCELYIRSKVSLLNDRINSCFKTLKFKLFHEQQNGGIAEVCQVLIPCESGLVEYEKANNAAKINAGLELIEVLSSCFGVSFPVFVDNAESVTELLDIQMQVISLIVSEDDKQLRFEKV